jgi:murein DD-endopeptidase MepM/ murein hydrolase activator NlpD
VTEPRVKKVLEILPGLIALALIFVLIPLGAAPESGASPGGEGMGMPYEESALANMAGTDVSPDLEEAIAGVPEPLEYSKPQMLLFSSYTIQPGDTIGEVARIFGLNQDTLLSLNNIKNSRLLQIGQVLKIPNQDGILHRVKNGDTLEAIAKRYEAVPAAIQTANELFSEAVNGGASLFSPGARLDQLNLQEINGELFFWPVSGIITSPYGYRPSPFTGVRQFHTGLDIACPTGTVVRAAQAGRVSSIGYDGISGNFVVITHHAGYRSLYAHLHTIRVKSGAYVKAGEWIGDSGNTGLSTGPHLHFTVYRDGVTVNPWSLLR